jgi:hypothetical protein
VEQVVVWAAEAVLVGVPAQVVVPEEGLDMVVALEVAGVLVVVVA